MKRGLIHYLVAVALGSTIAWSVQAQENSVVSNDVTEVQDTEGDSAPAILPVSYVLDLGKLTPVSGISFQFSGEAPEQLSITDYKVYASDDGIHWTNQVMQGSYPYLEGWPFTAWPEAALLTRYLRIDGLWFQGNRLAVTPQIESPMPEFFIDYNEETISVYCSSDCEAYYAAEKRHAR